MSALRAFAPWRLAIERRKFIRIPLDAEVLLRFGDDTAAVRGTVRNISGTGILISAEDCFDPDAVLNIEVVHRENAPSGNNKPLTAEIRIIRCDGEQAPFDLAAEFLSLNLP